MTSADLARRLQLIVITDTLLARPRAVVNVVAAALQAGAPAIQLRDKAASARELFELGRQLLPLVRRADALFFVNDRLDVALALGADGVHLGPDDIPVRAVRGVVPPGFLVGTSTDEPSHATRLAAAGADYIGCGTVYETTTKPDAGHVIGLDGLDAVARSVDVPVVGIGGVNAKRSREIATTSASGVAVIGSVMTASDPGEAVKALLTPWLDPG